MSIDPSLKAKGALVRHRNVLTRAERVQKLQEEEKWSDSSTLLGLPKVSHRKSHAGKKAKEAKEGVVATEGVVAAAPAAEAGKAPAAGKASAAGKVPAASKAPAAAKAPAATAKSKPETKK